MGNDVACSDGGVTVRRFEPALDLLAAALDAAPSGIVLFDRDLRIVGANRAAERHSATRPVRVGSALADALPDVPASVTEAIERAFETGQSSGDLEIRGRSGGGAGLTIRVFPVSPSGGRVEVVGC
jgi:PAS domain-containing protein